MRFEDIINGTVYCLGLVPPGTPITTELIKELWEKRAREPFDLELKANESVTVPVHHGGGHGSDYGVCRVSIGVRGQGSI